MMSSPKLRESLMRVLQTTFSTQDMVTGILKEIQRYRADNIRSAFNLAQPTDVAMTRTTSNASMESAGSFCEDDNFNVLGFMNNNSLPSGSYKGHGLLNSPNFRHFVPLSGLSVGPSIEAAPESQENQPSPYANFDFRLEQAPFSFHWMPFSTASNRLDASWSDASRM